MVIIPIETLMEMPADVIAEAVSKGAGKLRISVGERNFAVEKCDLCMIGPDTPEELYGLQRGRKMKAPRRGMSLELLEVMNPKNTGQPHRMTVELLRGTAYGQE
jgi:hypothetical protein